MGEPQDVCKLTDEERHLIRLLRHSPQSVTTMPEALYMSPEQTQDSYSVSTAKSASCASSAMTPSATGFLSRHSPYMNIIHDLYDIYALDCLIKAAYSIY
jgi:hypothetical protein